MQPAEALLRQCINGSGIIRAIYHDTKVASDGTELRHPVSLRPARCNYALHVVQYFTVICGVCVEFDVQLYQRIRQHHNFLSPELPYIDTGVGLPSISQ